MKQILILEDNKFYREMFENKLKTCGYATISHADPYTAMEYISENNLPDAILLDLLLPGVNGIAFIHELQSHEDMRNIPIIVCSSIADKIEHIKNDYDIKISLDKNTMHPDDLVYAVNGVLK